MVTNPDTADKLQRMKYDIVCEGYRRGEMTEAMFVAGLRALGYTGVWLADEKRYQDGLKGIQPIGKAVDRVVGRLAGEFP